jgi:hypothetical protein
MGKKLHFEGVEQGAAGAETSTQFVLADALVTEAELGMQSEGGGEPGEEEEVVVKSTTTPSLGFGNRDRPHRPMMMPQLQAGSFQTLI